MKNLTIISLFVCLSAVLASCAKTDVAPANPQNQVIVKPTPAQDIANPATNPNPVTSNINNNNTLEGTWKIANDSTHYDGGEVASNATSNNYKGTSDDYFTFTNTGKVYIKENGVIDTANYSLTGNYKVVFKYTWYNGASVSNYGSVVADFNAINVTSNSVTLNSNVITTQGVFSRVLNLKK
ncbi:hypothetical protein ACPPVU_10355 [Mucilaginibacter sp. McL0603]|uniref:hypothetical protein n=1 Tax=Mucilaginibacter sp. McL0603 TaxID=3415670 RepID=UPI003CEDA058